MGKASDLLAPNRVYVWFEALYMLASSITSHKCNARLLNIARTETPQFIVAGLLYVSLLNITQVYQHAARLLGLVRAYSIASQCAGVV